MKHGVYSNSFDYQHAPELLLRINLQTNWQHGLIFTINSVAMSKISILILLKLLKRKHNLIIYEAVTMDILSDNLGIKLKECCPISAMKQDFDLKFQ